MSLSISRDQAARERFRDWSGAHFALDALVNPFGVPDEVQDAIAHPQPRTADDLIRRIARWQRVPESWVVLANGIDEMHAMIARWRSELGPIVAFPPSDPDLIAWLQRHGDQVETLARTRQFGLPFDGRSLAMPSGATAVVMSPNDPSGILLPVQEAVRLSRLSSLLVIDERHAAYSSRTLVPLVREWDNVVVVQTFELFAALDAYPLAFAVAPPRIVSEIAKRTRPSGVATSSVLAAHAALDHMQVVQHSVRRVVLEKGRLYRQMRKLSMVSPAFPSWANFLLLRCERGSGPMFVRELKERGILVKHFSEPGMSNYLRVSAVSGEATLALKDALIEIALDL